MKKIQIKNKIKFLYCFLVFLTVMIYSIESNAQLRLGVFADCQYCNCDTRGTRFYRNSPEKLQKSITRFNQEKNLEFVVGLGDLIDRDFASFSALKPILDQSVYKIYNIPGNHDFEVEKDKLNQVPSALGLDKTYFTIEKNDWMFIFLNGNEITFNSSNPKVVKKAEKILAKLNDAEKPNAYDWNGGVSRKQIKWLKKQLNRAQNKNLKVALFCHYPILPYEAHALWNSDEMLDVITRYDNVKIWLNGHNHKGNYTKQYGIHFLTLKAMVETENENAFSIIEFSNDKIDVKGFGRESDKELAIE